VSDFKETLRSISVPKGSVRVFWLEQSHFVVVTPQGARIHIDPFLSREVKPENHIYPMPLLAPADAVATFVLLTHDHRDHTDPHTLLPMAKGNPSCRFYGPREAIERCRGAGMEERRLLAVAEGDSFSVDGVEVSAVHAESTGDKDDTTHLGFIVHIDDIVIYNVGDSRHSPELYADRLGPVRDLRPDIMIVPINEGYNNPGPVGARRLVEMVDPRLVIPCHFGCFKHNTIDPQLFLDALDEPLRRRVRILDRGASLEVSRTRGASS